jgi:hypothetical protein
MVENSAINLQQPTVSIVICFEGRGVIKLLGVDLKTHSFVFCKKKKLIAQFNDIKTLTLKFLALYPIIIINGR